MPRVLTQGEVSDFKERLCDAAAHLFFTKGAEGFTLRELAAALGVSPMTPYRYFKDKDAILAAVRTRAFDKFSRALEDAFAGPGDAPSRASAAGEAYIRFALEDPTSYKLMFDLSQDDALHPELAEAGARARLALTRHIHPLVEAGILEGDPVLIGHIFWAMLHGAVMLRLAGKLDCDFTTMVGEAFRALVSGFRPKGR
ncbi:MAG TPA: TetR/AcrR family transcriptional regulator [Rhizomicrobium sp.]|jgi:AcrR family transcriptional regulator